MHYRLMHISDLHTGWHFDMAVAEQMARQAHEIAPDLLVISGDTVLRADLTVQWNVATSLLKMLPQPQLIVPGNHDVSLFNGFMRLFYPLLRYHSFICPTLNPVFIQPGLAVVGGCTAHGLTVDGGRLYPDQIAMLDEALSQFGDETCKVLVLHHHVVDPPGVPPRRKIANTADALRLMDRHRVALFLCGHVHASYVGTTRGLMPELHHETVISQCGTTTSRRGRGQDRGRNSFHLIDIEEGTMTITPHFYEHDVGVFVPSISYTFPRHHPLSVAPV